MKAHEILKESAQTFVDKGKVYGKNYLKIGPILATMYPDGLTLKGADDFNRFHLFLLEIVKTTRYAENFHRGGHHDSVIDGATYWGMLGEVDMAVAAKPADNLTDISVNSLDAIDNFYKQAKADPNADNDYMRGYNNGVILAHSAIFGHEPDFIEPLKVTPDHSPVDAEELEKQMDEIAAAALNSPEEYPEGAFTIEPKPKAKAK